MFLFWWLAYYWFLSVLSLPFVIVFIVFFTSNDASRYLPEELGIVLKILLSIWLLILQPWLGYVATENKVSSGDSFIGSLKTAFSELRVYASFLPIVGGIFKFKDEKK